MNLHRSCALCFAMLACISAIEYSEELFRASEGPTPEWATYRPLVDFDTNQVLSKQDTRRLPYASDFDDSPRLDSLNTELNTFFSTTNPGLYTCSNGFLAITEYPLCQFFCRDYTFHGDNREGGWFPILGLYLMDLNPSSHVNVDGSGVYMKHITRPNLNNTATERGVLVEYFKIPPFSRTPSLAEGAFTGQAELWESGEIIYRYRVVLPLRHGKPFVGLIYTPLQFIETEPVVPLNEEGAEQVLNYNAVRYAPKITCGAMRTCMACLIHVDTRCVWCTNMERCVARTAHADYCSDDQVRMLAEGKPPSIANATVECSIPDGTRSPYKQVFGSSLVAYDDISFSSEVLSVPIEQPLHLSHAISFASNIQTNVVVVNRNGTITSPWIQLSIGVLASAKMGWNGGPIQYIYVPSRALEAGGVCQFPQAADPDMCQDFYVFQWKDLRMDPSNGERFTFQVSIATNGSMAFHYNTSCNATTVFAPFRYYSTYVDLMSRRLTTVPVPSLRAGLPVTLTSLVQCPHLCMYGDCNVTSKECVCNAGIGGPQCTMCLPSHFGEVPNCQRCPRACWNGGVCSPQNGTCLCPWPYSGDRCEIKCELDSPPLLSCPEDCNSTNTQCHCGKCYCLDGGVPRLKEGLNDLCNQTVLGKADAVLALVFIFSAFACGGAGLLACRANRNRIRQGWKNFVFSVKMSGPRAATDTPLPSSPTPPRLNRAPAAATGHAVAAPAPAPALLPLLAVTSLPGDEDHRRQLEEEMALQCESDIAREHYDIL